MMALAEFDNQIPALGRLRSGNHISSRHDRAHEQGEERNRPQLPSRVSKPAENCQSPVSNKAKWFRVRMKARC